MVIFWNEDGVGMINSFFFWLNIVLKGLWGGYYIVGVIELNFFCFFCVFYNVCFEVEYFVWKFLLWYDVIYYYVKVDYVIKMGIIFK